MQHKCKLTVLDKKLYPELQAQYCTDPQAGACPYYNVGDSFVFERYGGEDNFFHVGIGTLTSAGETGFGSPAMPHCSELWDAISRYIYTALQGGSIMRGWMRDERVMIGCCSDGTRPVIFKLERQDYKVLYIDGIGCQNCEDKIAAALSALPEVNGVVFLHDKGFAEVFLEKDLPDASLRQAVEGCGGYTVTRID